MIKRKPIFAIGMAATMALAGSLSANAADTTAFVVNADISWPGTVTGEITAVSENSITIRNEDGNEITAAITEETTIEMSDMPSDTGGMPDGNAPSDAGTPPEKPAGDSGNDSAAPDSSAGDGQTPPEKPAGDSSNDSAAPDSSAGDGQTPPEKPAGDSSNDSAAPDSSAGDGQTPPEKPAGDSSNDSAAPDSSAGNGSGTPPEMPSDNGNGNPGMQPGGNMTLSVSDLQAGSSVTIDVDEDGNVTTITIDRSSAGGMQPGMNQSANIDYTAATEYTEDTQTDGETYSSTGTDENAVLVSDSANVTITGASVSKVSEDSTGGDNASFYGVGAAMLAADGTLTVSDSEITTDSDGGAGIFSYGNGLVYAIGDTISTSKNTSGGIHAAGGGTLYAWDCTATTDGESSAAIRSDRGGGTMVIDGGTYTSNGVGSPAVYCTADISVNNAALTATGSEAVCIEGLNSLRLFNCDLTGSMTEDSRNDCIWNVILYQSMSGDSEVGNSDFEMQGGTLTIKDGGIFYTTNTESSFTIENVSIKAPENVDFFLKCTGNSNQRGWGSAGSNGADSTFTAINQDMNGDVIWDSISKLDLYATDGSVLTGAAIDDESNAGNGGDGYCNIVIDSTSKWIVTGDSTLTSLANEGSIVDESGNTVTIQGADGTVYVQGNSNYTITVESYSTAADTSVAGTASDWSDYSVDKPSGY